MDKKNCEGCWISLILRLAFASLFAAAAISKWSHGLAGLNGLVTNFQTTFKDTWLPGPLVTLHARLVPYIEAVIPVWLLLGFRLRLAWVFTALFMVTLAFGLTVAQSSSAVDNYFYVLMACAGIYFSQYDRTSLDSPGRAS